jgi:hypothetical protein
MRKIEKLMIEAIKNKASRKIDNTQIEYLCSIDEPMRSRIEHSKIYLHGNHIASYIHSMDRFDYNPQTLAQWPSRTTKSRLKALGFPVFTKKGRVFVGSKLIS